MGAAVSAALAASVPDAVDLDEEPARSRRLFLIGGVAEWDSLARLLSPFSVQQARLTEVSYSESGGHFSARLQLADLSRFAPGRLRTGCGSSRSSPVSPSAGWAWRLSTDEGDPSAKA